MGAEPNSRNLLQLAVSGTTALKRQTATSRLSMRPYGVVDDLGGEPMEEVGGTIVHHTTSLVCLLS